MLEIYRGWYRNEEGNKYFESISFGLQLVFYSLFAAALVGLVLYSNSYNEVVYTVETDYIKWVTQLPAITICPAVNRRYVSAQLNRLIKGNEITPQNVTFYANLVNLGKNYCAECTKETSNADLRFLSNITETVAKIMQPCESQFLDCSWNDVKFSCCQVLQPIPTKRGLCYSLNSLQTRPTERIPFNFVVSHSRPKAELKITASSSISLNIHDRRAVSFHLLHFKLGEKAEILYKFQETVLLPTAWELNLQQRRCAFEDELNVEGYRTYSFSACKLACLAQKQVRLCGCKHHHLRGPQIDCDLNGLKCLDRQLGNLTIKKKKENCGCRRDCTEQEIQIIHVSSVPNNNKWQASVVIKLAKSPTERTVLHARTNKIELLVALACFTRMFGPATLEDFIRGGLFLINSYCSMVINIYKFMISFVQ